MTRPIGKLAIAEKTLKTIAAVTIKGELGYLRLDWRDAQGMVLMARRALEDMKGRNR